MNTAHNILTSILCLTLLFGGFPLQNCWAKTLCVDVNAKRSEKPDGSCWQNPYVHLEDALSEARANKSISSIWIADGIYRPSKIYTPFNQNMKPILGGMISFPQYNPGIDGKGKLLNYSQNQSMFNQRLITFDLVDNVELIGGFQGQSHSLGGETSPLHRSKDIQRHQTILDGNTGSDKVWHVLIAGNDVTKKGISAKLDRLVIKNGDASNAPYFPIQFPLESSERPIYYHDDGGGLYIFVRSNLTLTDMTFEGNKAISGGAIYVQDGSTLTITNSTFFNNSAFNGGAISARSGGPNESRDFESERVTKVNIYNSLFRENKTLEGSGRGSVFIGEDTQKNPPKNHRGIQLKMVESIAEMNPSLQGAIVTVDSHSEFKQNRLQNN